MWHAEFDLLLRKDLGLLVPHLVFVEAQIQIHHGEDVHDRAVHEHCPPRLVQLRVRQPEVAEYLLVPAKTTQKGKGSV